MKPTQKEIEDFIEELKQAMIEKLELDNELENIKLKQQKAQKRLSMAREALRNIYNDQVGSFTDNKIKIWKQ